MTKPTLLILAAGLGSRYGGLKQMEAVGPGGETIMDYSIYDAMRAGFGKIAFVIRRDMEQPFKETIGARFENRIPLAYAFQELNQLPAGFSVPVDRSKPWGTAHAILQAAEVVQEPFAAINADDFYGAQSYRLLAEHFQSGGADYAMVGFVLRNTLSDHGAVARGVCDVDENQFLRSVRELTHLERDDAGARNTLGGQITRLTGDEPVSMNFWGFRTTLFAQLKKKFVEFLGSLAENGGQLKSEYYIPSVVNDLVAAGQARVQVMRTTDSWFGVTYQEDRPRVVASIRHLISQGGYPANLWSQI